MNMMSTNLNFLRKTLFKILHPEDLKKYQTEHICLNNLNADAMNRYQTEHLQL